MFKFFTKTETLSHPVPAVVPTSSPKAEEPVRLERIQEPGQQTVQSQYHGPCDAQGNYTGNPADLVRQAPDGYRGETSDYGYVGTHNITSGIPGNSIVVRR